MTKDIIIGSSSGSAISGGVAPEGVSFDGVTDYLSRSADLVGNVDSKTFTFSTWIYRSSNSTELYIYTSGEFSGNRGFSIILPSGSNTLLCYIRDINGTVISGNNNCGIVPLNTFVHILISCDINNNLFKVYINDINTVSVNSIYTNATPDLTKNRHYIGADPVNGLIYSKGRLSNVFLDYTYRDLSIEANRRLFITADGKPASGLETLNPILYLPMTDASTAHINLGTGGNFVQNGTLATADRGANQDNCVASKFDGVDDYLSRSSLSGIANGKQFTFSYVTTPLSTASNIQFRTSSSYTFYIAGSSGRVDVVAKNSVGTVILNVSTPTNGIAKLNTYNNITISCDLSVLNKINISINGIIQTLTINTFTNDSINWTGTTLYQIGRNDTQVVTSILGELYFDTTYIDLAANNPFWDSVENKPIPVRKAMATLGSNPLICMPLDASNPTKNYGSGGDFTLNGGGLVGARGMSEYISRSAYNNGNSNNRLVNTSVQHTLQDGKTFSFFAAVKRTTVVAWLLSFTDSANLPVLRIEVSKEVGGGGKSYIVGWNSAGTVILQGNPVGAIDNGWNIVFVSIDMANPSNNYIRINDTVNTTFTTFIDDNIKFSQVVNAYIGSQDGTGGSVVSSEFVANYFTTEYIDFSQEANRNLFVNQLGYPRDLYKEIKAGNIPKPLIYLPFDDSTNLGKNLGTGGDFTVNGTVTVGSDFTI